MKQQITLAVRVELLSAAIIGSGYSIPGGEDIAICLDAQGCPYLKGTTMKGLLRESLVNVLCWKTAGQLKELENAEPDKAKEELAAQAQVWEQNNKQLIKEILGEEGWEGSASLRRLHITDFVLENPPADPADCQMFRTFTKIGEDGIVADGMLRVANSACKDLVLTGEISCANEDAEIVEAALEQIKWLGTMRSRGFGHVRISYQENASNESAGQIHAPTACIHYILTAQAPLAFTDLCASSENSKASRRYIPGSSVRGMVINRMLDAGNEELLDTLLSDQVRFLDALPNPTDHPALPAIKGFYEDKAETVFETVVKDGNISPRLKRANLGTCCGIDGDRIVYWSGKTSGTMRIARSASSTKENEPFQTYYLESGQAFEGYILLDKPELAEKISDALTGDLWIGADRYAGFGKCTMELAPADRPLYIDAYSYTSNDIIGKDLYMLLLSPMTMLDENGEPCGLDCGRLAKFLGVDEVKVAFCSTSVSEYGGFNRKQQKREASIRMYDAGCLFHLTCDRAPTLDALMTLMERGLGIRSAEGFGQILFLPTQRFECIVGKSKWERLTAADNSSSIQYRQARCRWIMNNSTRLKPRNGTWSDSLIGDLQAQCEKAISKNDSKIVDDWLKKQEKYVHKEKIYDKAQQIPYIRNLLSRQLTETLGINCEDSIHDRLQLICDLIDYSRKEGKRR